MKRALVLTCLLLVLPVAGLWLGAGIAPTSLGDALRLGTGLSAKLACSSTWLSGFDESLISDDLASYSSLTRLVTLQRPAPEIFQASLGPANSTARYRAGLGCTLEYGEDKALTGLRVPAQRVTEPLLPREQLDVGLQATLDSILEEDNREGQDTRALLVWRGDAVVAEAYGPGIDRNTPLLGWSMGKSLTAILLGRLEALGKLQRDESDVFEAWRADDRAEITVAHLLQMTSGLAFNEVYLPGSDSTRMLFMSPSASAVAMHNPLVHRPGTHFAYSSGTTNLLAQLLANRLGGSPQTLLDFFHAELAAPLALKNTIFELDASGVFVGSSFAYASARDWGRLGGLMLNDGLVSGQRLLPEGWVAAASAPNNSDNDTRYGYQFWLNGRGDEMRWPSLPEDAYAMLGNRKQMVMIIPSRNTVIVRLGWSGGDYPEDGRVARILQQQPGGSGGGG